MATIYDLKPRFQALLRPLCQRLAGRGATANQVTLATTALSIVHGLAIYLSAGNHVTLLLLPVTLFVRMALNAIDGMLAREHHQKSKLGAVLNEVTDVVSDAALYLPFAVVAGVPAIAVILAVLLAGLTELTGLVGQTLGAGRRYDGPMGKSDRAFAFGLFAVLLGSGMEPGLWSNTYIWLLTVLLAATVCNRGRKSLSAGAPT